MNKISETKNFLLKLFEEKINLVEYFSNQVKVRIRRRPTSHPQPKKRRKMGQRKKASAKREQVSIKFQSKYKIFMPRFHFIIKEGIVS
jgi:hypothetical protein